MKRRVLLWSGLLVVAYLAALVYVWLGQERLVFAARPLTTGEAQGIAAAFPAARSVHATAADGTRLHAWYLPASADVARRRLLLYFGGESEQVHWLLARPQALAGWGLLLVDYRGYGLSEGAPSDAAIDDDAALWLRIAREGTPTIARAERVVVMGTSVGSRVATHLAASRAVDGVALVVPVDSEVAIAQARYPNFPMRWLMRDRRETIVDAPKVHAPTIFFVAANDAVVSSGRSKHLYAQWDGTSRTWVELPNASHDSAAADPFCWQRLAEFLRAL
jgi:pimeloyl-ACP methyl ester carboxylesterase